MSARRKMAARLETYGEVRAILAAIKNMALAELHRLAGLHENQRRAMRTVERAAADFVAFHPPSRSEGVLQACIVVGSERGFCGEFNAALAQAASARHAHGERVLLVGSRLAERAAQVELTLEAVLGANVTEELAPTIERVLAWLEEVQRDAPGAVHVSALLQDPDAPHLLQRTLVPLPLSQAPAAADAAPRTTDPPCLSLPPQDFLRALADQALMLSLHELFSVSLIAENRRRLEHMEGALRRLDETTAVLGRRMHAARQEDITQEIEVIMLSAQALAEEEAARSAL
jgi:F-type H+-transporting ATPase subunit gamma